MPVTFTTDISDAQGLALDASVQSEMTVVWDPVLNNGQFRLEYRDDDPDGDHPDYQHVATVAWDGSLERVITGLVDGEQYSVRLRSETDYVTGEWLSAEEITKLIAGDQVTATSVSETSIDLEWAVNSDFRGSQLIYRRRTDYEYDDVGRLVGTVGSDATTFTDSSAQPDREYRYQVRAQTQWVRADSEPLTVSTDGIGLSDRAVSPRGWHIEVDHPSGTTITPDPLEGATRRPTINGFPRVEIPVPFADKWHSDAFDDADLRVWHDGEREPIGVLEHRSLDEGSGSKQTVLEGRGGTQLDKRVVEDVDIQPTHEFGRDLLDQYTDYQYNVDNPDNNEEERVLQAADSDVELQQATAEIPTDVPGEIGDNGQAIPYKTAFTSYTDIETGDGGELSYDDFYDSDQYINGRAAALGAGGDTISYSFDLEYEMTDPAIWFYYDIPGEEGDDHHGFRIQVDDENIITANPGALGDGGTEDWQVFEGSVGALSPGTHTIEFQRPAADTSYDGDVEVRIDIAGIVDARYNYTQDHTLNEPGGHIPGPEEYPDLVRLELEPITTPLAISEVTLEVESDDGGVLPELGIGVDGTDSYDTVTDALTHTYTYSELATTARAQIGVGRDPDVSRGDQTPTQGFEPRGLDSLELRAVLDDTPVITDRSFKGKLMDVLREVFGYGNFVSEVRQDGSETTVEVTQLEGRPADVDPDIADYSVDRQTEDVLERAIVYGGAARVTRQTVDVAIGSWVDLPFPDSRLVEGKTSVYSDDTEFELGTDYELRRETADGQPRIKALSDGELSDSQTVSVDADVKPRGEFTAGDASAPERNVEDYDIPGLASKQMCDQVALYLVEETGDAIVDAEVTVPHDAVEWSVIEAIDPDQLPGDGPYQVRQIEANARETTLQLGQGQTVGEAVQEIRDRTQRNSERV